jgi:hypothetical protein
MRSIVLVHTSTRHICTQAYVTGPSAHSLSPKSGLVPQGFVGRTSYIVCESTDDVTTCHATDDATNDSRQSAEKHTVRLFLFLIVIVEIY